jgi:hypothetical protein
MKQLFILLSLILCAGTVAQDSPEGKGASLPQDTTYNYKSLYENGFYEEAVKILESMVKGPHDTMGEEPLKTLAFAYILLNRQAEAVAVFKELLSRNPEFSLDPIVTPPRFFEVFHQSRMEWQMSPEGRAMLLRRKAVEDSLRLALFNSAMRESRDPAYVRVPVCLLPGGAGQFYHRQYLKGGLLLAAQTAFLGAAVWSYNQRQGLKDPQFGWTAANQDANLRYVNYMRIEFGLFSLAYLGGAVEAFLEPSAKEKRK